MKLKANRIRPVALCAGLLLACGVLVSCGGGGTQANTFVAKRVIAFGDEMSVINADGSKYTVNAVLTTDNTKFDCASNPIWVQSVAALYGLVFPQCKGDVPAPASRIWATNHATVADLATQIAQQANDGGFASDDMVTVLVGSNDIVAQFNTYPGVPESQLIDNLKRAGATLAAQVNSLAERGAKVLVSTTPDLGRAPVAGDRSSGSTNVNPGVLTRLSAAFNDGLLGSLNNDGRKIGLVQLDAYVQAVDSSRAAGGGLFINTTLGACLATSLPPACTTLTMGTDAAAIPPPTVVSTANGLSWLWADAIHLSAGGQSGLGAIATTRARNNPF
ncbi:MAG: hypothetical protein H7337_03295 [Rhizobacter sp.]|nr:hypothetical protein [Rhizobacter sp.]